MIILYEIRKARWSFTDGDIVLSIWLDGNTYVLSILLPDCYDQWQASLELFLHCLILNDLLHSSVISCISLKLFPSIPKSWVSWRKHIHFSTFCTFLFDIAHAFVRNHFHFVRKQYIYIENYVVIHVTERNFA